MTTAIPTPARRPGPTKRPLPAGRFLYALLAVLLLSATAARSADGTGAAVEPAYSSAIFAGGCFWCIEKDFEKLPGVLGAESGYTGGDQTAPTYEQVGRKQTNHLEGIRVIYDPKVVSYEKLVQYFFRHVDPTQADGQFCDRGPHYTTAIFVADDAQRAIAEAEKKKAGEVLGKPIVTPIREAAPFWLAEDYHQDFYKKNPEHYQRYRTGCGRDARIQALWGAEKN